jgi:hypothetical protein
LIQYDKLKTTLGCLSEFSRMVVGTFTHHFQQDLQHVGRDRSVQILRDRVERIRVAAQHGLQHAHLISVAIAIAVAATRAIIHQYGGTGQILLRLWLLTARAGGGSGGVWMRGRCGGCGLLRARSMKYTNVMEVAVIYVKMTCA